MKKIILLSAVAFLLLGSCAPCGLLVRGGANYASLKSSEDSDSLDPFVTPYIGVGTECEVADLVAVKGELVYSQQGAKYEDSEGGDELLYDGKFKLDYLNIPVMAKVNVSDNFFVEAGPQIGFLLSAKDKYDSPVSGEDDVKDFFKGTDFGANIGVGYQFDSGLNIGARYNLGLSNISDVEDGPEDLEIKNRVFSLGLGFKF